MQQASCGEGQPNQSPGLNKTVAAGSGRGWQAPTAVVRGAFPRLLHAKRAEAEKVHCPLCGQGAERFRLRPRPWDCVPCRQNPKPGPESLPGFLPVSPLRPSCGSGRAVQFWSSPGWAALGASSFGGGPKQFWACIKEMQRKRRLETQGLRDYERGPPAFVCRLQEASLCVHCLGAGEVSIALSPSSAPGVTSPTPAFEFPDLEGQEEQFLGVAHG